MSERPLVTRLSRHAHAQRRSCTSDVRQPLLLCTPRAVRASRPRLLLCSARISESCGSQVCSPQPQPSLVLLLFHQPTPGEAARPRPVGALHRCMAAALCPADCHKPCRALGFLQTTHPPFRPSRCFCRAAPLCCGNAHGASCGNAVGLLCCCSIGRAPHAVLSCCMSHACHSCAVLRAAARRAANLCTSAGSAEAAQLGSAARHLHPAPTSSIPIPISIPIPSSPSLFPSLFPSPF